MIIFTNENNVKKSTADWGMVSDSEGTGYAYILRYGDKSIEHKKEEIAEFLKGKVKASVLNDKWANCTCKFGESVPTGIRAIFVINEVREEMKAAPTEKRVSKEPVKEAKVPVKETAKEAIKPTFVDRTAKE